MRNSIRYEYIEQNGEAFFTVVLLPDTEGKFPVVICRSSYVKGTVGMAEEDIATAYYDGMQSWLSRGYAIVYQHCRGQGKSTGAFVPYLHEREDGLALREWIRRQPFYNGELFLLGASYTASLHYATAPFESDIKGAVFEVQDSERYRLWYRNGQMRRGHANWHFGLYKDKCNLAKNFTMRSFAELPLAGLSKRVLGDCAEDFEQMLFAPSPTDAFWRTRLGGCDTKDAVTAVDIPVLLTTGYNDFYVGGVFSMWERMSARSKEKCALLVSPYNHGDGWDTEKGLAFPNGQRRQAFGADYPTAWFDHIRTGAPLPFAKGCITYYRTFENRWAEDFYGEPTTLLTIPLGGGTRSFTYDPKTPPAFRAEGLFAEEFEGRKDLVRVITPPFEEDIFVKGRMELKLRVQSDCADTSFYARISIKKAGYAYVLRHDITSLCYQLGDYEAGCAVDLRFTFDEYAFLIEKGDCLWIDISSTDENTYTCHANRKGEYALQEETTVASNVVDLEKSCLFLPVEGQKKNP